MKNLILTLTFLSAMAPAMAFREIPEDEKISTLLEGQREVINLNDIAKLGLDRSQTGLDLWSGHYWPHFQGSLSIRYRDPSFISLMEGKAQWDKFKELFEKKPTYIYSGRENVLSPAEKYDLLVGDREMTLTKYSRELSEKTAKFGRVPTWRGICDGWASAAQKMPRPVRSVSLKNNDGQDITFYPEDIKALGSLLYARSQENVIILGKRCRNQALGLLNGSCAETNPATFHRALVNRVGKMKKTFIADVSPGSEVWNYPVKEYQLSYYNVFDSEEVSEDFKKVMEPFNEKTKNRFKKTLKRHKSTAHIVGVRAIVRYTNMRDANLLETDDSTKDEVLEKEYAYDLELDAYHNVVGGESLSNNLPDFIWAPNDRTYPLSVEEKKNGLPRSGSDVARAAKISSKAGQPLSVVIEKLFETAK